MIRPRVKFSHVRMLNVNNCCHQQTKFHLSIFNSLKWYFDQELSQTCDLNSWITSWRENRSKWMSNMRKNTIIIANGNLLKFENFHSNKWKHLVIIFYLRHSCTIRSECEVSHLHCYNLMKRQWNIYNVGHKSFI